MMQSFTKAKVHLIVPEQLSFCILQHHGYIQNITMITTAMTDFATEAILLSFDNALPMQQQIIFDKYLLCPCKLISYLAV